MPECSNAEICRFALSLQVAACLLLRVCRTDFYALIRQILQCGYFNRNAVPLNGKLNFKDGPDKMMLEGKIKCGADWGASEGV